jgi:hypothetical protein
VNEGVVISCVPLADTCGARHCRIKTLVEYGELVKATIPGINLSAEILLKFIPIGSWNISVP